MKFAFLSKKRPNAPVEFQTWAEACAAAGSYDSDVLTRFRIERSSTRVPDGSLLRGSVLTLVARLIDKPDLTVVDYGGATGDLGREFLNDHPKSHYTVVENHALVRAMENNSAPVEFRHEMPLECDIFYSSGTLQYLDEPMVMLRRGFAMSKRAVVLVRNAFSSRERFSVQRSRLFDNGVGPISPGWTDAEISYPHRTLIEADLLALGKSMGFSCVAQLEEHSGAIGGSYGRQLVFLRD